jgi:hypothetical protein
MYYFVRHDRPTVDQERIAGHSADAVWEVRGGAAAWRAMDAKTSNPS